MRISFIFAAIAALLFNQGCKNSEARTLQQTAATQPAEPLTLDPTDHFRLTGWWSNNAQLLQLRDDGGYTLFSQLSCYAKPLERGRWGQMSYAALRLEPYNTPQAVSTRVAITRTDGLITLHLRELPPFTAIDKPPAVSEDALLGEWIGPGGSITLKPDLHYTLARTRGANESPATLGGHSGAWALIDRTIQLQPASPSLKPVLVKIESRNDRTVLVSDDGVFQHMQPLTASNAATPPSTQAAQSQPAE